MRDPSVSDEERQREFLMKKKKNQGRERDDCKYANFLCSCWSTGFPLKGLLPSNYLLGKAASQIAGCPLKSRKVNSQEAPVNTDMIFTLPNLIRHFLNVFVGRAENSLRVLQSVMRHGKISLKENASSFTNVLRTSSLRTVASYQEAKQAQCSAFMPSSGSLRSLPKTL